MIRFGPSGNERRFGETGHKSTVEAPAYVAEMGLNAYEYSFGRGINIGDEKAAEIGKAAANLDVMLSVHAPYYINFANPDDTKAENSYNYVLNSALKCRAFGGRRIVFHPASVGAMTRDEAVALTARRIEELARRIVAAGLDDMIFCPETMGKINQIGDVAEVTEFCKTADFFLPTIDFGHINARTHGSLRTEEDFEAIVRHLIDNLGFERASQMHVHFSKIEYGKGGEVRHLTFADTVFGPEFLPLARVIKKYGLSPVIICESDGTQCADALEMKRIYESL